MIDPVRDYILGVEGAADDNMEDYDSEEKADGEVTDESCLVYFVDLQTFSCEAFRRHWHGHCDAKLDWFVGLFLALISFLYDDFR